MVLVDSGASGEPPVTKSEALKRMNEERASYSRTEETDEVLDMAIAPIEEWMPEDKD